MAYFVPFGPVAMIVRGGGVEAFDFLVLVENWWDWWWWLCGLMMVVVVVEGNCWLVVLLLLMEVKHRE